MEGHLGALRDSGHLVGHRGIVFNFHEEESSGELSAGHSFFLEQ